MNKYYSVMSIALYLFTYPLVMAAESPVTEPIVSVTKSAGLDATAVGSPEKNKMVYKFQDILVNCVSTDCQAKEEQVTAYIKNNGMVDSNAFSIIQNGIWTVAIHLSIDASELETTHANTLASEMMRMNSSNVAVNSDGLVSGIVFGKYEHFADLADNLNMPVGSSNKPYTILTKDSVLYIMGHTEHQLEQALWHVLAIWGYRQYFPTATWEVVPDYSETLVTEISTTEFPVFDQRHAIGAGYGCGGMPYAANNLEQWRIKNRTMDEPDKIISTGHSYATIINDNLELFDSVEGKYYSGEGNKLCVLEPEVQEAAYQHVLNKFETIEGKYAVSLSAADGYTGWDTPCESGEHLSMSPSDRQAFLADYVINRLRSENLHMGKKVAILAYGATSPAPNPEIIQGSPWVMVFVTAAYLEGGLSLQEVTDNYRNLGYSDFGIREYFSVFTWDVDKPGVARATRSEYVTEKIREYRDMSPGQEKIKTESSDSWGPHGLGYWILSRLMWEGKGADLNPLYERSYNDFIKKAFPISSVEMNEFYQLLDGSPSAPTFSTDLINKMYLHLQTAKALAISESEISRINDLILYTRYLELYYNLTASEDDQEVDAFDELLAHSFRMRETEMQHYRCVFVYSQFKDHVVALEGRYNMTINAYTLDDEGSPYSEAPFTDEELTNFVENGLLNNPPLPFEAQSYSENLVLPEDLITDSSGNIYPNYYHQGETSHYFYNNDDLRLTIEFTAVQGVVYDYKGDLTINLYKQNENLGIMESTLVDTIVVVYNDKIYEAVSMTLEAENPKGLYRLEFIDNRAGFRFKDWPEDLSLTYISSDTQKPTLVSTWSGYFYVPPGTKVVGGYIERTGEIHDPDGIVKFDSDVDSEQYFNIELEENYAGGVWKLNRCNGDCFLMTTPPEISSKPSQLLIPIELKSN